MSDYDKMSFGTVTVAGKWEPAPSPARRLSPPDHIYRLPYRQVKCDRQALRHQGAPIRRLVVERAVLTG